MKHTFWLFTPLGFKNSSEDDSRIFLLAVFPSSPFHYSSSIWVCVFVQTNEEQFTQQKPALYGKNERKFFFLNCRVESKGLKTDQKRERMSGLRWWTSGEWVFWVFRCNYTQTIFVKIREDTTLLLWPRTLQPWKDRAEKEREKERKSIISGMF